MRRSQEAALVLGVRELEGALVLAARLAGPAEPAQQVGARRVEVLVAVEAEAVDEGEPCLRLPVPRPRRSPG